jgi:hypothetical protein
MQNSARGNMNFAGASGFAAQAQKERIQRRLSAM